MKSSRANILGLLVTLSASVIAGCGSEPVQAPVSDGRPPPAPPAAPAAPVAAAPAVSVPAGHYMVKRGDTLYSIALENGADYRDVARWNGLDDPTKISVGQVLRVAPPEGAADAAATAATSGVQVGAARGAGTLQSRPLDGAAVARQGQGDGGTKVEPKALRLPYSEENVAMLAKGGTAAVAAATVARPTAPAAPAAPPPPAKPEPPKTAAVAREPGALDFIWPAKGGLLSKFSEPSSKGLDIGGKAGDPVVAAAAGQVLYTGTGIRGFGKLIVIRHENGFSSVYAHNREILVKEGQSVRQGQKIAELGDTDADRPKLHFEIRKSGKPVDPMRYLPGDRPS